MLLPRSELSVPLGDLFSVPYAVVGGVATRAYAPERTTKDIDVLIRTSDLETVRSGLRSAGGTRAAALSLAGSQLGLDGEIWSVPPYGEIDVRWSDAAWADDALTHTVVDPTGIRIAPLAALVLMKLDASRSVDQGDLARMLGFADDEALARVRSVIARFMPDAVEDLESYIELGRLELGRG
jgi:hypothetical protein